MKPTFPIILCAVALACSLAVWAFMRGIEEPEPLLPMFTNVPTSQAEWEYQLMAGGDMTRAQASNNAKLAMQAVTPRTTPSTSAINLDTKRILAALLESGMTPEEATRLYLRVTEQARIERSTRPPMPGVRQGIDTNRFPLFEEAP